MLFNYSSYCILLTTSTQFSMLVGHFSLLLIVKARLQYRSGEEQQGGFSATLGIVGLRLPSGPGKKAYQVVPLKHDS